ncbi:MAG: hypothetical protein RKO25_03210 [Candidatus Contendobacter sp.]|nr:hypothetical protein [Candidatus Contendobacter sp.]
MTIAKAVESTHEKRTARKLETATDPIQNRRPSRPSKLILLILKKIILQKSGTEGDFETVPAVPGTGETVPAGPLRPYNPTKKPPKRVWRIA